MEENKVSTPAPAPKAEEAVKARPSGNPNYEPRGSRAAARPGDRKYGDRRGRPSERRGGRGGFRREEDNVQDRVVDINRISRTESGGKHMRFDTLVVVGDQNGHYGFALRKSGEVPDAIKKSVAQAKKRLYSIRIRKGTIAHEVVGHYEKTTVILRPAPEGKGIVGGGATRAILELAGVKNVVCKILGSRTPINVVRATHDALSQLKDYKTVMVLRGLKKEEDFRPAKKEEVLEGGKANG